MADTSYLDRIWNAFDPLRPLPPDDPHHWYEDLHSVRGPANVTQQIVRQIALQSDRPFRVLLLGHAGCGKSTELGRVRRELANRGYLAVLAEVDRELDREDLELPEVQILLLERIGAALSEHGLTLPADLLRRVEDWFKEEEHTTEHRTEASATLDVGALMQRVFGSVLAIFKADLKVSEQRRSVVRDKVKRRLREFIDLVVEVVAEAQGKLQLEGWRGLVLVVDGLEKSSRLHDGRDRAAKLLLDYSEQWAQLPAPLVLTAPLNLLSEQTRIQNHYDAFHLLPAIPVAPRPDRPDDTATYAGEARHLLRTLVERRADLSRVFADPDDIDPLIERSGGSIRDLFRLIRAAIVQAPEGGPVDRAAVERAWRQHALQVSVVLQPDDDEPLRQLEKEPEKLAYDKRGIALLQRELVLPYLNGGRWFAIHPAIRDTLHR